MLSLTSLAGLVAQYPDALAATIAPIQLGGVSCDLDAQPAVMGVVNLSRDSTYRESIAISTESALRRGRIMAGQGATIIDVGAESSTLRAARVSEGAQVAALVPVIEGLRATGVQVSVEAYSPQVVAKTLTAGASVVNLTGSEHLDEIYELAAEYASTVVICFVPGANVREVRDVTLDSDPIPGLYDYFSARIDHARSRGVSSIIIDPGLGFYYGNLTEPLVRARHQGRVLLNSFRLRPLGVPICQAMPHAFDLFEEEFRTAEGFFAVMGALARLNVYRTHEVGHVAAVLRALAALGEPGD